jgi:hypothetical protein
VREVARLVDERMRQVAGHMTTYDVARIAILAALNLADELKSVRDCYERAGAGEAAQEQAGTANAARAEDLPGRDNGGEPSWFDAIFDAPVSAKHVSERLSTRLSARLQSQRQPESGAVNECQQEASEGTGQQ